MEPPALAHWKPLVNKYVALYKMLSFSMKCPSKFDKIWYW